MAIRTGRRVVLLPYALLGFLCLLLYLPGIAAIPPLDRDEARFAQATRQMLETGDFLRIRFQDEARNKKPAGIYWLQAAAVSVFSRPQAAAIWPYRLPSVVGGIAAVWLTFAFGAALFHDRTASRRAAFIAAVLLATALGVVAEAHIAKTDAVLLALVAAAQAALGIVYVRARAGRAVPPWAAAAFWSAEIAAIFIKGPVAPALAIATIATLAIADGGARWLRRLYPIAGVVAMTVVVAPWLINIERATEGRFIADAIGGDLLTKLVGAQESHGAPPFSYLLLLPASFWPASLLLVPALSAGWRRRDRPAERFLLAWLIPAWVILELVPTKLPHYVLPLFPALALLAAIAFADGAGAAAGWPRRLDLLVKAMWVVVALGLATLLIGLPLRFAGHLAPFGVAGAVLLLVLMSVQLLTRLSPNTTVIAMTAMSLAIGVPMAVGVLPGLDRLWLSRAAAALVAQHPPATGAPLVAVGYSEPSLVFLLGTGLRLTTPGGSAEILAGGGEAIVSSRVDAIFRQALSARGLVPAAVGNAPGLDYSNGQRMVLTLYEVAGVRQ